MNIQPFRQRSLDAQHDGENRFAADRFKLLAIVPRLVSAARAPVLRGVNVKKPLHRLIAVNRAQ
jgi:hypothetical protein